MKANEILLEHPSRVGGSGLDRLFRASSEHPLQQALFGPERAGDPALLEQRLQVWWRITREARPKAPRLAPLVLQNPFLVWAYPFALAQFIAERSERIFGFAGPPGVGKTSLVSAIAEVLSELQPGETVAWASLDDFYLSREERRRRGIAWRGPPGTHDLDAATRLLRAVQRKAPQVRIPRFDHARDDQGTAEVVEGPVSRLLFEGWFLGLETQGYGALRAMLDHLTYLDCPLTLARERRFRREEEPKGEKDGGGMSRKEVERFWREVLEPGTRSWVLPTRSQADLVIELDDRGEVCGALRQRP